jgi:hypothetical protein
MNPLLPRFAGRLLRGVSIAILAFVAHAAGWLSPEASAGVALIGSTDTFELNSAMKVLFQDSVVNNVITDSELMDLFEKDTNIQTEKTGGGRYIETAQMFGYNAGYGYRGERDYIPTPDGPIIKNGRIYLKKALGSVEMTADVFEKVQQGREAFISWADQAMPKLVERMVNEKDRILIGYGTGVKAVVKSVDATAKRIVVEDAYGIEGYTHAWLAFLEGERLVFGPNLDATDLRGGAERSARLLDINDYNDTLQLDRFPTGVVPGDYVFSGDDAGHSGTDDNGAFREFQGLHAHVDDGGIIATYLNIPRADHRAWRGIVVDCQANGADGKFTEEKIIHGDIQVATRGGGKIDTIIAPVSGAVQFWQDLLKHRVLNDPTSFTGGKGKLWMQLGDRRVEIRSARKLPPQVAFGLTRGTFKRFTLGKFEWDQRTGSMWRQVVDAHGRLDAFWAYGREYDELACQTPRKNLRWENLTEVSLLSAPDIGSV